MPDLLTSSAEINGIAVPDSRLGRAITAFVRDTQSELLFNHSSRVYFFGALAGRERGLGFNSELLYAAAMFHDIGLMPSRLTAPTPPATSCKAMAWIHRTSRKSGRQSRCTPRLACRNSCIPWSP